MELPNKNNRSALKGRLPACAELAVPYVPFQSDNAVTYEAKKGLIRGTLFPDLDLPFMGMINEHEKDQTPLQELQALSFAIDELGLYLDTHASDEEALELYRKYVQLYHQGVLQYEKIFGPLSKMQAGMYGNYDWLKSPWPWEFDANKEV